MQTLKTLSSLHPFLKPPHKSPHKSPKSPLSFSSSPTPTMPLTPIVDHIVLFKVRESTDPSKTQAMITNLRSLSSLNLSTFLTAGPILRSRSPAAATFGFTHLLYSRYRSKSDLAAYSKHPSHLSVVKENVFPICDDIMAFDWAADVDVDFDVAPSPGSLVRLRLGKLVEGKKGEEVVGLIDGVRGCLPDSVRVSCGESIAPERAKGYEVGFVSVFSGVDEGEEIEGREEKEKVRASLESVVVVDYVVQDS